jgi:hypothetical protein
MQQHTAIHREITEIEVSACQQTMEWIQSNYCLRVGYDVSATAIAPTNERTNEQKATNQSESANVLILQVSQIRKVECRYPSSNS